MIIFLLYVLVKSSNLEAVFTVSQRTVASILFLVQTVPTITSPAFIPIQTLIFLPKSHILNFSINS
jgi:hypothetical protein